MKVFRKLRFGVFLVVLAFLISIFSPLFFNAEASTNTITVGSVSDASENDTVSVLVEASSILMAGYQVRVYYDNDYLDPVSATNHIAEGSMTPNLGAGENYFQITWNHTEDVTVNDMFTVEFNVIQDIGGTSTLYINPNDDYNEVFSLSEGEITVNYEPPVPGGGGGDGEEPACYIATAVYGSYDADEVVVLRNFRDDVLFRSLAGRLFVRAYYTLSPPIADFLKEADTLNGWVRSLLDGMVSLLGNE